MREAVKQPLQPPEANIEIFIYNLMYINIYFFEVIDVIGQLVDEEGIRQVTKQVLIGTFFPCIKSKKILQFPLDFMQ